MFETARLSLRPFEKDDIEDVFAMRSDADIMRFIREPQDRTESENWIKIVSSRWKTEGIGFCAVTEKSSGKFIGWCGLWRLMETFEIEIGYAIDKKLWGRGFAVEASEALLDYGFYKLKLKKIVAVTKPENFSSRRVMEKLGMKFDYIGEFYELDLAHYSISKNDYFRNRKTSAPAADAR